jgi:hypothetical protein
MTASVKPIETEYQGCRFRSRLEARWAVFLDALDIRWEYEPQGYVIDSTGYLPDFWLPTLNLWAEVKGSLTHGELLRLIRAVGSSGLPISPTEERQPTADDHPTWGHRILLLGPIPPPGPANQHPLFVYLAGQTFAFRSFFGDTVDGVQPLPIGNAVPLEVLAELDEVGTCRSREEMLAPGPIQAAAKNPAVAAAYHAARSARFEHGESGSPKPARLTPYVDYSAPLERRAAKALKVTEAVNVSEPKLVPYHVDRPLLPPPIEAPRPSRPRKSPRTT